MKPNIESELLLTRTVHKLLSENELIQMPTKSDVIKSLRQKIAGVCLLNEIDSFDLILFYIQIASVLIDSDHKPESVVNGFMAANILNAFLPTLPYDIKSAVQPVDKMVFYHTFGVELQKLQAKPQTEHSATTQYISDTLNAFAYALQTAKGYSIREVIFCALDIVKHVADTKTALTALSEATVIFSKDIFESLQPAGGSILGIIGIPSDFFK